MSFWQSKANQSTGVEDMVLLSKVAEDQIVENLKKRYLADAIYTYIGPTLVAVNPYKKLPYFTSKEISLYRGAAAHENPPHIYALTDTMFQHLVSDEESQCVIISGESGAGKTESAKLVMNYIAAVSGRGTEVVEQVKRIILESNPLLESFGNAKTLRNNNSSRFGKYFEIAFARGGQPVGGTISNFLLEKTRVVGPGQGERNFHVFYQLTKAASAQEKRDLGLTSGPQYFNYLNCSKAYDADGIDDAEEYQAMRNAMTVCKISDEDQNNILSILAGVLHLGNVDFDEENNQAQLADQRSLAYPAVLLGIQESDIQLKLTSRYIETGRRGESYNVPLNAQQARSTRDALAKALYSRMFDWIVGAVNNAMLYPGAAKAVVLGVLDIYGFEIFQKNGYQQFSINYVNERLQQIFIELTLKNEQEEYAAEGIKWEPIPYFNNRVVVDLIEAKRPPGIFSVLDDVCATMHAVTDGADGKFVEKMGSTIGSHKHLNTAGSHFTVHHYAGSVDYDSDGFVESNKDTLYRDLIILMQGTSNGFIRDLFPESVDSDDKKRPTTAGMKIRDQSQKLVTTLMKCVPSYIRCIKPNENKQPRDWDNSRVDHQVRYLNLKENIKVRRAGFCYRAPFEKFLRRYAILTKETYPSWHGEPKAGVKVIMDAANLGQDQWQLGKTKVFVKAPESLFLLEELRERKFDSYAKVIQRQWRKAKARKHFVELRKKAVDILYKQKERRRESLDAEFIGDHLGNVNDNATLKSLVGKNELIGFAAIVQKYDRRYKTVNRELLITDQHVFIIGTEPDPKNKNVLMKVVKRKISLSEISGVMLSRHADNFVVIHAADYSTVCECPFKTELITILSENYQRLTKKSLFLNFSDTLQYTTKKTGMFQGSSQQTMNFVSDPSAQKPIVKPGKVAEIRVAPGLPPTTQPVRREGVSFADVVALVMRKSRSGRTGSVRKPQSHALAQAKVPPQVKQEDEQHTSVPNSNSNSRSNLNLNLTSQLNQKFGGSGSVGNLKNNVATSLSNPRLNQVAPIGSASGSNSRINQNGTLESAAAAKAKAKPPPPPPKKLPRAKALYAYQAQEADELTFEPGDIILIASRDDPGWWTGTKVGTTKKGLLPANYVELVD
ncbi:myosin-Ie-like protein [Gonapodya prolifera JEL478]|uniref:Myosin-Ie-like protein n=1 Tax=Gonapodya prolifera (strain JEL478) TaxID=1344416 RepID=A0A139A799_GONPJ|nr:myosin-Ie-like protein [Gonapodya prolifera JEL478]|eukprot:KXS12657.1 myosin-Ie-like protein [Gonapodya prolifera JEL478]